MLFALNVWGLTPQRLHKWRGEFPTGTCKYKMSNTMTIWLSELGGRAPRCHFCDILL